MVSDVKKQIKKESRIETPFLTRPEGFEPPTFWSVAKRSIQLSQGRIFNCVRQPNDIYYITPGALCQALRAIKSKLF